MATNDKCCTIVPYFKVSDENMPAFRALLDQFVAKTQQEPKCLYYGFSFNGDLVHCREGHQDAEGVLNHLDIVGELLGEALKISEIARLEVHGPADELDKLRGPLAALNPEYFTLEYGFRN